MVVIKDVNNVDNWWVYHRSTGNDYYLVLNQTAAKQSSPGIWGTTTSTFTIANGVLGNSSFIAYIYAHDPAPDGIIQAGSFTTDASGKATVMLGWEPQFSIYKNSSSVETWRMMDSMRGMPNSPSGTSPTTLFPNTSAAESAYDRFWATSTGFHLDNGAATTTYIYLAIRRPNKPPTSGTQVYNSLSYVGPGNNTVLYPTGFTADMVISKTRNRGDRMVWFSRLTGKSVSLSPNNTNSEQATGAGSYLDFSTNNGYKLEYLSGGGDGTLNATDSTFVTYSFRRSPGVFDTVAYTGNGTAHRVLSHNLGVPPELMIIKSRSTAADWVVYSAPLGNNYGLYLNQTLGTSGIGAVPWFDNTTPTTTTFNIDNNGGSSFVNAGNASQIAYLFASSPNISKVGSYTGNGGTLSVNAGFDSTARYILIKRTDVAGDWLVWDSVRGIVTGNDPHLSLNTTAAEVTNDDSVDPDATGFAVNQVAATNINVTGGTYIYLAIH